MSKFYVTLDVAIDKNCMSKQGLRLYELNVEELEYLERIYIDSFPSNERRLWKQIVEGVEGLKAKPIFNDAILCGFVTTWALNGALYVEHLVIDEMLRGRGLGGKVMQELLALTNGEPLILEVEPRGTTSEAERRIAFYERQGLKLLEYEYIQPPYVEGGEFIRLDLMSSQTLSYDQIEEMVQELYRVVYQYTPKS